MRREWVGGVLAVLVGSGAVAFGGVRDQDMAQNLSKEELIQVLQARLEAQQKELEALKAAQAGVQSSTEAQVNPEDAMYSEAEQLGITKAVTKSGLPEKAQRRMAIAIVREAKKNGLDPLLVTAVIRCESSFNPYAVSNVGAMGLMQVMPDTGEYLASLLGQKLGRAQNLFDPETNIELGAWYLADLVKQFGAVDKALVAYNAGPSLAQKILAKRESRKKFMQGYPKTVLGEFNRLKTLQLKTEQARFTPPPAGVVVIEASKSVDT